MKKGRGMFRLVAAIYIIAAAIIIFIINTLPIMRPEVQHLSINSDDETPLFRHGFHCFRQVLLPAYCDSVAALVKQGRYKEVKDTLLQNDRLKRLISSIDEEDNGYVFQDYIWIIQKSVVHTCHRDNNGDFFNEGQQYPSYTMIVYLEDMGKCLSVLPKSHQDPNSYFFNFTQTLTDIPCKKGDVLLFNANLIHVGTFNEKEDNIRVQLKVTHREDIKHILYYEDFNKVLNQENELPLVLRKAQRSLSCTFPGISDLTQGENIRTARGSDNGVTIGPGLQWFSYLFYGNKDFYNLPNAF